MLIYVFDDGETWQMDKPIKVPVNDEQLTRIEGGEKVSQVVPDWDVPCEIMWCNCVKCTTARTAQRNEMEPNDYALCVHCGASHHIGDDHTCAIGRM